MTELEEIPAKIAELEAEMAKLYEGSGIRRYHDSNGIPVVAFTDCGDLEYRWAAGEAYAQMIEILYEEQRRLTGLHDPNRCDPRNVRKEFKDNLINLGRRVNQVPDRSYR